MSTSEVLIVGAGPAGLTAALELARRRIQVRIIDAAPGPATTSRAIATHARTLETYDQLGILDAILERGHRIQAFSVHQNGRRLVRFGADYSHLPTRTPFSLLIEQVQTETVLREALSRHGVQVEWGCSLQTLSQDSLVHATVMHEGVTERLDVDWLIGADGGHSVVRRQLGLKLTGDSSETWLIADATLHGDLPADSIHWLRTSRGAVMAVPLPGPGRFRLLDTAETSDHQDPQQIAARFAAKLSAGSGLAITVDPPTWTSVFTIQQRMIERMRVGRCFVVGDAAHVHSPASGQGMNTGIQDSVNLAWRVAMVVRGQAGQEVLDGYDAERVPVGRHLLAATRKATTMIQARSRWLAMALPVVFGVVRNVPPLKSRIERKIMGGMSALGLSYHAAAVTAGELWGSADPRYPGAFLPTPVVGERVGQVDGTDARDPDWAIVLAALRDPRWKLLLVNGSAASRAALEQAAGEHPEWLSVLDLAPASPTLRRGLSVQADGWLLVRPDGYLAGRGTGLDAEDFAAFARVLLGRPDRPNVPDLPSLPGLADLSVPPNRPVTEEASWISA